MQFQHRRILRNDMLVTPMLEHPNFITDPESIRAPRNIRRFSVGRSVREIVIGLGTLTTGLRQALEFLTLAKIAIVPQSSIGKVEVVEPGIHAGLPFISEQA